MPYRQSELEAVVGRRFSGSSGGGNLERRASTDMTDQAGLDSVGKRSGQGWWKWTSLFYAFTFVAVSVVLAFSYFQPITVLPRIRLAPGFSLTNQLGERRTSEDYRGMVTIYGFSYSRCGVSGVEAMSRMQDLRQRLRETDRNDVKFALVTITVDPVHDSESILQEFAARFEANGKEGEGDVRWDFLRGDLARTKYIIGGGFGIYFGQEAGGDSTQEDPKISLEQRFVLVDGWGIIRAVYRGDTFEVDRVMRDLKWLVAETKNSNGVASLAYEAAHLFRCYP
jgi:protein SCO1